MSVKEEEKKKH